MRKRLLSMLAIACLGVMLVGCGDKSKSQSENDNTSSTDSTSTSDSTSDTNSTDSSKDEEKETLTESDKKDTQVSLAIYSADVNSLDLTKLGSLKVMENDALIAKLDKLTAELSKNVFDSLPIKVEKIETINGKKVAIVNLEESIENKKIADVSEYIGANWASSKFQGSAGGSITTKSLIETFLQRDYKGSWIDGVKFTYNNKPIEFDHVSTLSEISYR